jgi:predicted outer membrane lipoprotein
MKIVLRLLIALVVLAAAFGALNYLASERVEVLTLHTLDAAGAPKDTRIWVLDHEGRSYIRTSEGSGWHARLVAQPTFDITRSDVRATYTATERPELRDTLNPLFREKYGWGDAFISAMVGGRESAIILELVPAG